MSTYRAPMEQFKVILTKGNDRFLSCEYVGQWGDVFLICELPSVSVAALQFHFWTKNQKDNQRHEIHCTAYSAKQAREAIKVTYPSFDVDFDYITSPAHYYYNEVDCTE